MAKDVKKARRERHLVSLQIAEGLARMGAVCEAGASMTAEFVALCQKGLLLFNFEQGRQWLAFKVPEPERRSLAAQEAAEAASPFVSWCGRKRRRAGCRLVAFLRSRASCGSRP